MPTFPKPPPVNIPDKDKENHDKDIITDPDRSHLRWRIKEGENFTQVFYANQKKCQKTTEGKTICMKLFLRGICNKSFTRAHKLSTEDEKAFDNFVNRCREGGATKPDFWKGARKHYLNWFYPLCPSKRNRTQTPWKIPQHQPPKINQKYQPKPINQSQLQTLRQHQLWTLRSLESNY